MTRPSRRTFLQQAAAAGIAASFTIAGTKSSGMVLGANDTVRLGVVGIRGRGGRDRCVVHHRRHQILGDDLGSQ